jgi:hypothetical protein
MTINQFIIIGGKRGDSKVFVMNTSIEKNPFRIINLTIKIEIG